MDYKFINESEISECLESGLKKSLCICFPKDEKVFSKVTYWQSVPSYRVYLEKDGKVVSHIAVIDRVITVVDEEFRIAGIQSVFVLPEYRGSDICKEMFSHVIKEAQRRGFDFSLLGCMPELEKYYQRFGYKRLTGRQILYTDEGGNDHIIEDNEVIMWRPVCKEEIPTGNVNFNGNKW